MNKNHWFIYDGNELRRTDTDDIVSELLLRLQTYHYIKQDYIGNADAESYLFNRDEHEDIFEEVSKVLEGSFYQYKTFRLGNFDLFVNDTSFVACCYNTIQFASVDINEFDQLSDKLSVFKWVPEEKKIEPDTGVINVIYSVRESYSIQQFGNYFKAPFMEDHYNDNIINKYKFLVNDFKNENGIGSLAILNGMTGSGKTHLIRSLVVALNSTHGAVYVPSDLITQLQNPALITCLAQYKQHLNKQILLVIEEADSALHKRVQGNGTNASYITNLLSLSDGLIGSTLGLKIVVTSNLKDSEIDEACLRPGRLSTKINFGHLDPVKAKNLYFKHTNKEIDFHGNVTLAEVYSAIKETKLKEVL